MGANKVIRSTDILLYMPANHEMNEEIQLMVEKVATGEKAEVCGTVEHLSRRLHQPRGDLSVAILVVVSPWDLTSLLSIRDLLYDISLILILPDREKDTLEKAHTLRPRFLTFIDSDLEDVGAVLARLLNRADLRRKVEHGEANTKCAGRDVLQA